MDIIFQQNEEAIINAVANSGGRAEIVPNENIWVVGGLPLIKVGGITWAANGIGENHKLTAPSDGVWIDTSEGRALIMRAGSGNVIWMEASGEGILPQGSWNARQDDDHRKLVRTDRRSARGIIANMA